MRLIVPGKYFFCYCCSPGMLFTESALFAYDTGSVQWVINQHCEYCWSGASVVTVLSSHMYFYLFMFWLQRWHSPRTITPNSFVKKSFQSLVTWKIKHQIYKASVILHAIYSLSRGILRIHNSQIYIAKPFLHHCFDSDKCLCTLLISMVLYCTYSISQ